MYEDYEIGVIWRSPKSPKLYYKAYDNLTCGRWVVVLFLTMKTMRKSYPSDLTDEQWQLIEPLLPAESAIGHPRNVQLREIVDGIFYVQREGCTGASTTSVISHLGQLCMATCDCGRNGGSGNRYMIAYGGNYERQWAKSRKQVQLFSILNRSRRRKKGGGLRL